MCRSNRKDHGIPIATDDEQRPLLAMLGVLCLDVVLVPECTLLP